MTTVMKKIPLSKGDFYFNLLRGFVMNFGQALEAVKAGAKVQRAGWNGKGMWIAYTPGSTFPVAQAREGHAAKHRANELTENDTITLLPHIDMKAADGSMVIGWLASQTDMLADDWQIAE